jgi:hypothetical protein
LKRREQAGLAFDGSRWIEMEGTRDADLRVSGSQLHLRWEMQPREMSLHLDTPQKASGGLHRSELALTVLPRRDSVPDSFPRFACSDPKLTEDLNRLYWERAFTYPSPAGPAAWFEWMAIIRAWHGGPPLYRGEIPQQENPGAVGVDLPFPESGLVPCFFLYGVIGAEAEPGGLRITPRLPRKLSYVEVRGVDWRGYRFTIRALRDSV